MNNFKVTLMSYTLHMVQLIYSAYRQCYSKEKKKKIFIDADEDLSDFYADFVRNCMKRGHLSPLEHATFTFNIQGCSRVCTHQLVRHRLASYSQQSQRYVKVNVDDDPCVIPESIKTLDPKFKDKLSIIYSMYKVLVEKGVPQEDARYILPEGTRTNIVVTMNLRELLHFFNERLCSKAQDEIREVANAMAGLVIEVEPWLREFIGPKCQGRDACMDGELVLCSEHYRWRFEDEEALNVSYEEVDDEEETPTSN